MAMFLNVQFKKLIQFVPWMSFENTKTELLPIVREDDSDDEVDDQSEEVYDVNGPEPPPKKNISKLSDFLAGVYKDKSTKS